MFSRTVSAALIALGLAAPGHALPCRQALALALDVSGSVDAEEYRLQLDGLAAALTDPQVVEAFVAGAAAPVRLMVYEWSGPAHQRVILGWTEVADAPALSAIATTLRSTVRVPAAPSTALGTAMAVGAGFLSGQPDCWTRTLDISGDGTSNTGPRPQDIGHLASLAEITVNALAIGVGERQTLSTTGDLVEYFRQNVIRGPGAFVEHAAGFADFEAAMVRKLLRETRGLAIGASE
ncbi:DUF1194 domain-containing protein [Maritimibacter fusiformis]|uniref:DUF1194 domain-containing protein n=1 Tax=Maritimibacter fusiformis TaxID=2603819 RepID=A0A5D0RP71_9RHOB|nr:DUF1194 domain-containing protein [Maritimibacter fusiformis]TYB82438.1 DUF1194 domain-containing protein [Maritimibacter fusiformis]